MPLYLDWHDVPEGVTAEDMALAHLRDLQLQDRYGARYMSYWFDPDRGSAFCLVEAPSEVEANAVHLAAHGIIASRIIEVKRFSRRQRWPDLARLRSHRPRTYTRAREYRTPPAQCAAR